METINPTIAEVSFVLINESRRISEKIVCKTNTRKGLRPHTSKKLNLKSKPSKRLNM